MKTYSTIMASLIFGASLSFTGCGSDSDDSGIVNANSVELKQDGKTLIFYSMSTNDHVAYNQDSTSLVNLNGNDDLANFNMDSSDSGKLFIWIDNKGDDNASNDEEKVIMFKDSYTYSSDNNATWEDFYYLGHYHVEEEDGDTHYHLAAHTNDEFDLSNVPEADLAANPKYNALKRLNIYLAEQETLRTNLQDTLDSLNTPTTLCGFKSITNDNGTRNYAVGTDGKLYVFTNTLSNSNTYGYIDQTTVASSCEENKMGISAVSHDDEDGVVVFEANSQKLYLVDSHDGGIYHVHSTYDVSEVIGSGKSAQMMVSFIPVKYELDEDEHEY